MTLRELADGDHRVVRTYEYEDATMLVADLRIPDDHLSVDVVDGTGIIVVTHDGDERQYEVDVPDGEVTKAIINNGVVTIEVAR